MFKWICRHFLIIAIVVVFSVVGYFSGVEMHRIETERGKIYIKRQALDKRWHERMKEMDRIQQYRLDKEDKVHV